MGWGTGGGQPHATTAYTPGKEPVPILQGAGWAPGPVWTGGKSRPHRDSIPNRPACTQSLHRQSYPAHYIYIYIYIYVFMCVNIYTHTHTHTHTSLFNSIRSPAASLRLRPEHSSQQWLSRWNNGVLEWHLLLFTRFGIASRIFSCILLLFLIQA